MFSPCSTRPDQDIVWASAEDEPCIYFVGNSLGPLPNRARKLLNEELDVWATTWVAVLSRPQMFAELTGSGPLLASCIDLVVSTVTSVTFTTATGLASLGRLRCS